MATLVVHTENAPPVFFPLVKPLTSVGASTDSDLRLADVRGVVAIQFDGARFTATALDGASLLVNGKKRDRHPLVDGDALQIGRTQVVFHSADGVPAPHSARATQAQSGAGHTGAGDPASLAVQRLSELAASLAKEPSDRALSLLLDAIVEVTSADKGFLIVVDAEGPRVTTARNFQKQDIANAVERLSDSIVARVLESRQPLIVSDALHDASFNASASVVNLKLSSVMCVPLVRRGELFGAVYVGNDRAANLFTGRELLLMTSFCSTAALLIERALELDELRAEKRELQSKLEEQAYGEIIGSCDAMKDIFRKIDKVAGTDISIMVTGETGTGKELIARELHRRSPRRNGAFVAINCGAIPEQLLESELFGHAKGAFTGAVATRPGRFQTANGGTLFLDEIGEMPPPLQVKLLRALQERTVTKVGEQKPEPVDIRVVAATNKDLELEMKEGRFREDLFYRVNVVALHLPPLRERGDDAVMLAKWFLGRATRELNSKVRNFTRQALIAIRNYRWPGNIRQLENRIKKAVVLAEGTSITPLDLELRADQLEPILSLAAAQQEWRDGYISDVLERNDDNKTKTAKDLDVDPRTIFRHLERMEAKKRGATLPAEADEDTPGEGEA